MNSKKQQHIKAAIINLGCKVNKYEADSMGKKLIEAGMQLVEPEELADIYIVNTCSVTNIAQKKSRQMLRRAKRRNPEAVIVAAGCYVNAEHEQLMQENFVDVVVSNNRKKDIADILMEYLSDRRSNTFYVDMNHTDEYEEMGSLDAAHLDHQRAYIKIQDGCNQFCSYCIIPYTRGRVRSRNPEDILAEIEKLSKEGVKEFVLTGIHISSYGVDFKNKKEQLGSLVKAIAEIPSVVRIRLGSLEPRIITDEFLEILRETDKFCPHFHLSLQSACNDTLKRMNRKYTIEEFMEICARIRQNFDMPAITTDVIVGFPEETEEEFAETIENLKKLSLYEIHVFKYSVRAGTVAEKLPNQISESVKGKRSECLLALTAEQKKAYETAISGMEDTVLVEEELEEPNEELLEVRCLMEQGESDGQLRYYTGHTTRYVKVLLKSSKPIVNRVVAVQLP